MNSLQQRYTLLEEIGRGGMGTVYQALDRLTMRTVALKRVLNPQPLQPNVTATNATSTKSSGDLDGTTLRLLLAREFQMLAALQHPNIIEVLDYGFDAEGLPFFTMRWLKDAQDIITAGSAMPVVGRIGLMVQLLRAVNYLHQRDILHRDLKPTNVLVAPQGTVYVLDFGLALSGKHSAGPGGSIPYLAPEILSGQTSTVVSDLYSLGVIFYELLLGRHPFAAGDRSLIDAVLTDDPDLGSIDDHTTTLNVVEPQPTIDLPEPDLFGIDNMLLADIIRRLLARDPAQRFQSAAEVIHEVSEAVDFEIPLETPDIQDSVIQQPHFVGRQRELRLLTDALDDVVAGDSAAWLVAGESGVGKTRLVNELRIRAMVRGVLVIRTQVDGDTSNRQLWQPVVRRLLLSLQPTADELELLRELEPRVGNITGTPDPDIAVNTPPTNSDPQRYIEAWRVLLARQSRPVMIIIENLHHAMPETLNRLQRMLRTFHDLPVYWLGIYRDDESPAIPKRVSAAATLKLPRLSRPEIGKLVAALLGTNVPRQDLLDLLERDTGGNPFIIIEIMRTLAQQMGGLSAVRHGPLPPLLRTPSTEALVRRRLSHIPGLYRRLFVAAALDGRRLDLAMLRELSPAVDLDHWLADGLNAAVLTNQDDEWYFSHEQIREGVIALFLTDLGEKRRLHHDIANAIERAHGNVRSRAPALAHHYAQCGEMEAARHYMAISGESFFREHHYTDAIPFLKRAVALMTSDELEPSPRLRTAYIHRLLGAAYARVDDLDAAHEATLYGLHLLGEVVPLNVGQLQSMLQRVLQQRFTPGQSDIDDTPPPRPPAVTIAQTTERALCFDQLAEIALLRNDTLLAAYGGVRGVELAEDIGASAVLARLYATYARTLQIQGDADGALRNADRAVRVAEAVQDDAMRGFSALQQANVLVMNGRWNAARDAVAAAQRYFSTTADHLRYEEAIALQAVIAADYEVDAAHATDLWEHIIRTASHRQDYAITMAGYNGLASVLVREQAQLEAVLDLTRRAHSYTLEAENHVSIRATGLAAMAYTYQGDTPNAIRFALQATDAIVNRAPHTRVWRLVDIDATLFALLTALEKGYADRVTLLTAAARVQYALSSMVTLFPIAQPSAQRWLGLRAFLTDDRSAARTHWQSSLDHARALSLPYEEARTLIEYARVLGGAARADALNTAQDILSAAGATNELQRLAYH
jgi:eukaryotic-like serine/threonine-protein kinase